MTGIGAGYVCNMQRSWGALEGIEFLFRSRFLVLRRGLLCKCRTEAQLELLPVNVVCVIGGSECLPECMLKCEW
jgi:hypothetical protein